MKGITRRKWLVAAGATTAVAGTTDLFGQDKPATNQAYNFQDILPRELIGAARRRRIADAGVQDLSRVVELLRIFAVR